MLSRFVVAFAVLAAVAALPTTDKALPRPITTINEEDFDDSPWFSFPMFGNLFAPLWRLLPSFSEVGPRIVSDENKFQVIVNVKDYKKDDLKVKIKGDFILVQGTHEAKHDDHDVFASQFFHTYTLPINSSSSDVDAELSSDGFLTISAPINNPVLRSKDNTTDRDVPIKETGVPLKKEEPKKEISTTEVQGSTTKEQTTGSGAPVTEAEDDRKEPTTAKSADRDESTDKDNRIPHGNEISP